MFNTPVTILIVDDHETWRNVLSATVQELPGVQVIGQAADGLTAVRMAEALKPNLILLDLGVPTINGLEVARRVRKLSSRSVILFVSENRSIDIVYKALEIGASGFVVKSDAASQLISAVVAVLEGKQFLSSGLNAGGPLPSPVDLRHGAGQSQRTLPSPICHHEVGFYYDDGAFTNAVTLFVESALNDGRASIVIATEQHLEGILHNLCSRGVDLQSFIEDGSYIPVDVHQAISNFVTRGVVDPLRYMESFVPVVVRAQNRTAGKRVAIFGEGVNVLWGQGNIEAAIQVEKLCNQFTGLYNVEILCAYSLPAADVNADDIVNGIFHEVLVEHSAVYSW